MLAPNPPAQPVAAVTFHPAHHRRAVPIMEVACPAPQHLVGFLDHFASGFPPVPMVKDLSQMLAQCLSAFLIGFHVHITELFEGLAPSEIKAQKVDSLLTD